MFGSRDFSTLKWKFCIEFAVNRHCAHYRTLKIAQWNALSRLRFSTANSLQFTAEIYYEVGISREPNIC